VLDQVHDRGRRARGASDEDQPVGAGAHLLERGQEALHREVLREGQVAGLVQKDSSRDDNVVKDNIHVSGSHCSWRGGHLGASCRGDRHRQEVDLDESVRSVARVLLSLSLVINIFISIANRLICYCYQFFRNYADWSRLPLFNKTNIFIKPFNHNKTIKQPNKVNPICT
jgi:hypothetical protein